MVINQENEMNEEQAPKEAKTLNWLSSEKKEAADKPIDIGVNVIQDSYLLRGVNVIFTLDNQSMVFKENNDRKIIKNTGLLGKASVEIISPDSTPCQGNVYACLEDDTQIEAPPFQIEFTAVPPFVATVDLEREKNEAWANDADENRVTATVYDNLGNRVKGQQVIFNVDNGAMVIPPAGVTDKDGKIAVSIRSDKVGEVTLTAQSGNITKAIIVCFTTSPYRLDITDCPHWLSSFGIVSGCLYKNGIGEPNIPILVATGMFISLDDDGKNVITDKDGCFSFRIYSDYIGSSYRYTPPRTISSSIGIRCLDDRIYYGTRIMLS